MIGLFVFFILLMALIYVLLRNTLVYREKMKLHHAIFLKDKNGRYVNSIQIFDLLKEDDKISYQSILLRFWRKPSSFQKELLEKIEESNKKKLEEIKWKKK